MREMQRRRSEEEREKRDGKNWRRVATEQRTRRAVRRIFSSVAQFQTTPTNIFRSPPPALSALSPSFPISVSLVGSAGDDGGGGSGARLLRVEAGCELV